VSCAYHQDKTISIWRVSDWQCIHILGGHKEPICDISIHPSGKLALSVSKDNTLKLWNLIHGMIDLLTNICRIYYDEFDKVAVDSLNA
jgi:protein MAK11